MPAFSCAPSPPRALADVPRLSPALSLHRPQFDARTAVSLAAAPRWRLLLLGDGHVCQQLSALASAPLCRQVCSTTPVPAPRLPSPERFAAHSAILCTETLSLQDGTPLLVASCWSTPAAHAALLADASRTRAATFAQARLSASREILALHYGIMTATASHLLHVPSGTHAWAREYVFRRRRATFMFVHEIFSPAAAALLGTMPHPSLPQPR